MSTYCMHHYRGALRRSVRHSLLAAGLLVLSTVGAGVANAQSSAAPAGQGDERDESLSAMHWEVTPFVGYRMGGDFDVNAPGGGDLENHGSFGLAVNLAIDESSAYELFYSRQETSFESSSAIAPFDLKVEYLHLGGTLVLSDELPVEPYMVGGLGLTRLTPQTGDGSEDTRFSLSLGAGVKMPITQRFAVRVEARGFVTFINSDSAFLCASGSFGGACAVQAKTDSFFQYELLAGATFRF
jgi:opacity protein-like surface antigen